MHESVFLARRRDDWERLETLLARADRRGLRRLAGEEIAELAHAYRAATSDLGTARGRGFDPQTQAYLNRLVARAHAYVYGGSAERDPRGPRTFLLRTFPREFRRSLAPIAVCAALTVLAAIAAYVAVASDPRSVYAYLPAEIVPEIKRSLHDSNFNFSTEKSPFASAQIITNNVRVTAAAFAGGMTLGVLTVYSILFNGAMVGALLALFSARGFGTDFFATIAPHGVLELSAIQIGGGAGLLLAHALVAPGRLARVDALRIAGRRAVVLFGGACAMLVVAGTIEGFFTPLRTSIPTRFGFGGATAIALFAYLAFAGRAPRRARRRA